VELEWRTEKQVMHAKQRTCTTPHVEPEVSWSCLSRPDTGHSKDRDEPGPQLHTCRRIILCSSWFRVYLFRELSRNKTSPFTEIYHVLMDSILHSVEVMGANFL
jgi:hypothetical protein